MRWCDCSENKVNKESERNKDFCRTNYFEIVRNKEDWNHEIEIEFFSHFGEPSFKFIFEKAETEKVYDLEYNLNSGKWTEVKN